MYSKAQGHQTPATVTTATRDEASPASLHPAVMYTP